MKINNKNPKRNFKYLMIVIISYNKNNNGQRYNYSNKKFNR